MRMPPHAFRAPSLAHMRSRRLPLALAPLAALALAAALAPLAGLAVEARPSSASVRTGRTGAEPVRARAGVAMRPIGPAAADPTPTAVAETGICTVHGRQTTAVVEAEQAWPFELTLSLSADCPVEANGRADIYMLLDVSASMAESGKAEAAVGAVREFIDNTDFERHRIGLVPFNNRPYVALPLSDDPARVERALDLLPVPRGTTDIAAAMEMARNELKLGKRLEAVAVMVLLTDGQSSESGMLAAADNARRDGVVIFTVGLGPDAATGPLQRTATSPDHYYHAPTAEELDAIYARIAAMLRSFSVTDVRVFERPSDRVALVLEAGATEPELNGALRVWWRPFLTPDPLEIDYTVRVDRSGRLAPSAAIWVEFTDGDLVRRRMEIPPLELEVRPPVIHQIHLPLALRGHCFISPVRADVALVLDASASMAGDKLLDAVNAARVFVDGLDVGRSGHRLSIVTYAAEGRVLIPLGEDPAALHAALDGITTGAGTRLDRGILTAVEVVTGEGHDPDHRPVIVMLTDGRQVEAVETVADAADWARLHDIDIYAIGLGDDVDPAVLRVVAGSDDRVWFAPDGAALREIYAHVAGVVDCR